MRVERTVDQLSGDQYRLIVEHSPAMIWRAGLDGGCDFFNEMWLTFTGRTLAQEVGLGWAAGVHDDDLARCVALYEDHFVRRQPFEMEYRLRRHDGEHRWILDRGVPFTSDDGEFAGFIGSCVDVHERRLDDERRRQTSEVQQEAIRARDAFLNVASHELRTPLTPLLLQLESIERMADRHAPGAPSEQVLARVRRAVAQVMQLNKLVDRLLDVSRLTAHRLILTPEPLDLVALAREVVERHLPQLEQVDSLVELRAPEPVPGAWDRLRVDQVVSNLLANAIKHAPGKPIHVDVSSTPAGAVLRVTDEGLGLSAADQERIFDRFEHAVEADEHGGFALGLWLTRQLVEAMGGEVAIESEPGHGATFTVSLPSASRGGRATSAPS